MIRVKEILDKTVVCDDLTVGDVKEIIVNPAQWKITHLELKLTKDAADLVFGARKGGIRNMLAVSSIDNIKDTINLKVRKGQLKIFLSPPKNSRKSP